MRQIFFLIILVCLLPFESKAQGCSDAGACSIGDIGMSESSNNADLNTIQLGLNYGLGMENTAVSGISLSYSRLINDNFRPGIKVNYSYTNGDLGTNSGFGDIFINLDYFFIRENDNQLSATAAFKAPLSDASASDDGSPLPMVYQTSLGTYDLIAGMSYSTGGWTFNLAWQQPVGNDNRNMFFPSQDSLFPATNSFERKADVLLRISREFDISPKLKLRPGVLPIYHIANDEYTDMDGEVKEIDGSEGLTLNANIFVEYTLGVSSSLIFSAGSPIIARETIPDGLLRNFAAGVNYIYNF
ncbi:MAG: hypothetical protein ACOC2K_03010 [Bacteroidota bacterium]